MANENTPGAPRAGSPASPEPDPWVTMPRPRQVPPEGEAASPFARPAENPWGQPSAQEPTTPIPSTPTVPYPVPEVQPYPSGPANPYGAQPGESAPEPGQQPWEQAPQPQPWEQAPQPQPWEQDAAAHHPQPWQGQGQGQGQPGQPPWASAPLQVGQNPSPSSVGGGRAPQPGPYGLRDANPLSALFDFGFTKFATPGLVKIVYTLFVVAALGSWVMWVLVAFVGTSFGAGAASGLVVLLFGWIPAVLSIAFTRFILEGIVALIRIHDRVTEIAERRKDAPDA